MPEPYRDFIFRGVLIYSRMSALLLACAFIVPLFCRTRVYGSLAYPISSKGVSG